MRSPSGMRELQQVAAWVADRESERFMDASPAALALFGYTLEEFLKLTPAELVLPEQHKSLEAARSSAPQRWGLGSWWTCLRKDGSTFRLRCRYHIQQIDGRDCFVVIAAETEPVANVTTAGV